MQPFDESYNPLNATRTANQIGANTNDNSTLLRDGIASDASQKPSSQAACHIVSASNASSVEPSSCLAAVTTTASPTTAEPRPGLITSTAVSPVVKNGPRAQQVPQQNTRRLDDVTVVVTRGNTGRAVTVTCTSCTSTSQSALSDSLSGLTRRSSGSSPASCDSASTLTSPFQRSMSLASKTGASVPVVTHSASLSHMRLAFTKPMHLFLSAKLYQYPNVTIILED